MNNIKEILVKELNLTEKEFSVLADYAYCDRFNPNTQSVSEWQQRQKESIMEEEMMEMELGESLWRPGDKNIIINILNRSI